MLDSNMRVRAIVNSVTSTGRVLSRYALDLMYPKACPVCGTFHESAGATLCPACSAALSALENEPFCPHCAKPVASDGAPCPWCRGKGHSPYEQVIRLGEYEEPLHALILQLKYQRNWTVGELLAERLLGRPRVRALLEQADAIVAVPLHWRQQYRRGYNQSEVIARHLAKRLHKRRSFERAARRTRETESQTRLTSQKAREENVRDAFAVRLAKAVEGKRVVVVDDVMTTGATIRSLGRVLLAAKPLSLSAIVIAVADPKRRDFQSI